MMARLIKKFVTSFLVGWLIFAPSLRATEYFIGPSGNDTTGNGTSGNPWKTLTKLKAATTGCGDTWTLLDGTYDYAGVDFSPTTLPSCSSWSSSTTVRAQNDFSVIITTSNGLNLRGVVAAETTYYVKLEGIIWKSTTTGKNISGHHIYLKDVGLVGGPMGDGTSGSGSNVVNLDVGNNDFGAGKYGATDVLIEDFFVLGLSSGSGRYGIDVFNSNGVLLRNGAVHMENGWICNSCGNPSASINFYNSINSYALNVLDVDSGKDGIPGYECAFYATSNSGTGAVSDLANSGYYGSAVINGGGYAGIADGSASISSFTYRNVAGVDTNGGLSLGSHNVENNVTADGVTLIVASATPSGDGIAKYSGTGTTIVRNSIVKGFSGGNDFRSITSVSYSDTFGNGSSTAGTGMVTYNPLLNGASIWLSIATGSALKTAGLSGGQIGAEIRYRIGADGLRYGETGWDTLTAVPVWPFRNEAVIKTWFCAEYSTYGWCSSSYSALSLTDYVHARGNAPDDFLEVDGSSPTAPTNLSTATVTSGSLSISWTASTDNTAVTGYEVDLSTDNFSTFSAGYNDYSLGDVTSATLSGLSSSTTYSFRVRAKDAVGNTSDNSSTQTGTTIAPSVSTPNMRGLTIRGMRKP